MTARRLRPGRAVRAVAVVAVLALTACSPPRSVSVGIKDYPTDILLKQSESPSPSPAPVIGVPGFPIAPVPPRAVDPAGPVVVPLPPDVPEPAPVPVTCPKAGALVGAQHPATTRPEAPPREASYRYRVSGGYEITGPHAAKGVYPASQTRAVHDVVTGDGFYAFTISDDTGLSTTYSVVPEQRTAAEVPVTGNEQQLPIEAGIYVSAFSYQRADGTTLTLAPEPDVMVARLPLAAGDKWSSKGVDATTGVTVVVNGQVGLGEKFTPHRDRIDACGNVLDAYWVEYTIDTSPVAPATSGSEPPSSISGGGLDLEFVGTQVAFANQYGGLPLHERIQLTGTDGPDTVTISREAVITAEPALAAAP